MTEDVESRIDEDQVIELSEVNNITYDDPHEWPKRKKYFVLSVISVTGMIAPLTSAIFFPVLQVIKEAFHTTDMTVNSLVAVFVLTMGICPLGWAAYSDKRGTRRNVYLLSLTMFVCASILCAVSPNIWLLIIMRALQACGSSAVMSVGAGTLSDMYKVEERGTAYGFLFFGVLFGPLLGPLLGGYIDKFFGWRWILWFLAIFGTILFVLIWFLPETYRDTCKLEKLNKRQEREKNSDSKMEDNNSKQPVTCIIEPTNTDEIGKLNDRNKERKSQISVDISLVISTVSTDSMASSSPISPSTTLTVSPPTSLITLVSSNPTSPTTSFNSMLPIDASPSSISSVPQIENGSNKFISFLLLPLSPLLLLRYPNLLLIITNNCTVFAMLYTQSTLVSATFQNRHYFLSPSATGLVLMSRAAGYMVGGVLGGRYADIVLAKGKKKNKGELYAEMRLNSAWFGIIILPLSFTAYGWCVENEVFIVWPLISMFFGGLGILLCHTCTSTYLVDAFPGQSASVISVYTCIRYIAAALMSLLAASMENALGDGWTFTTLAFLNIIGASALVLTYYKGRKWREDLER
ncbi:8376_t:CDS:2 [Paraglomus occultum]|uniref:8376_t:CDS:1 n=1 Tax=Paraglomus occultum TaxID=144539 RepID=A0A9N9GIQ1_9GLOM|nr:8376_t:CDS:2 [Paraglomus occultum]